ncbi:opacity protein-like surface antigen [Deinobacterium chartae]|uniref:Opacity protein-like surface antigen n=1 Tax=Deinobacterium chartae TaxID=521158 RepID=A0A841I0H4_9DEIO|nr:hypothetical protein [Deinobacterium chartae]MBB6097929.1 opacity protein-like surface antigen [Deinobacterium chartae]
MKRLLLLAALFASSAQAANFWASAGLSTRDANVSAGFQLLPVPFLGSIGPEASLEMPWNGAPNSVSLGATWRDIPIPLSPASVFAGAGVSLQNGTTTSYLEGGVRTEMALNLGLRFHARAYPNTFRAGVGLELTF